MKNTRSTDVVNKWSTGRGVVVQFDTERIRELCLDYDLEVLGLAFGRFMEDLHEGASIPLEPPASIQANPKAADCYCRLGRLASIELPVVAS